MPSEVVDVSVLHQGHVSDDVILLGAGVDSLLLVLSEMYEIYSVFLTL